MTALALRVNYLGTRDDADDAYEAHEVNREKLIPPAQYAEAMARKATISMENAAQHRDLVVALWYWASKYIESHPDPFTPQLCSLL